MSDATRPLTHDEPLPVRVKLRVVSGPDFGKELVIEQGSYTIGRVPQCNFVLADPSISRFHLLAQAVPGGVKFTDNGSANGSFFQGRRFTAVEGSVGTEVTLGKTVLRVELATAAKAALAPSQKDRFGALLGRSLPMRQTFAVLERLAASNADVLLVGETGTGKEAAARAIHEHSSRRKGPWVVVDFATLSHSLLESELFGHVRGAFTGATADRPGPFELASGGTVFLDELPELPLDLQSRLLRVLERREVRRVGTAPWKPIDVRVIASTRKNLEAEVKAGRFREDLYYRLSGSHVVLPPLRDRPEDIPLLAEEFARGLGKQLTDLSPETRALMAGYAWPGNLRELKNTVERALQMGAAPFASAAAGASDLSFKDAKERLVGAFEQEYLVRLMERCGGNLSRAARESGVGRIHLRRLMRKHGLRDDGPASDSGDDDEGEEEPR